MIYMKQAAKHIREMLFAGLYTIFRNFRGVLRNFRGVLRNFRGVLRNSRSGLSEPDLNRGDFLLYKESFRSCPLERPHGELKKIGIEAVL
jgi:hypothetical protein